MKRLRFWIGVAISALFLYLVVKNLDFREFWQTLHGAKYVWLLPGVVMYFLAVWARAWRWHYLLRPVRQVPTRKMFPIVAIGYMGNNIYPARAGEVLRAVVLKKRAEVSISASLATIIVERVFDAVVMLGFVFLNLPELARLTHDSGFVLNIQALALLGAGIFTAALGAFILAAMFPARTERIVAWSISRFIPARFREKIASLAQRFLGGLESLRSPREALMVLLTSIVIWLLETGKYWFVMLAFPFQVSFFALMLMNGIVNLVTTIPSAPGYVGTFDKAGIAVLEAYGVNTAVATGYTLVLHIALWLPITLLGAYFLAREGIRWEGERGLAVKENLSLRTDGQEAEASGQMESGKGTGFGAGDAIHPGEESSPVEVEG